jgi:hypothetical protein
MHTDDRLNTIKAIGHEFLCGTHVALFTLDDESQEVIALEYGKVFYAHSDMPEKEGFIIVEVERFTETDVQLGRDRLYKKTKECIYWEESKARMVSPNSEWETMLWFKELENATGRKGGGSHE